MSKRYFGIVLLGLLLAVLTGCPRGSDEYNLGKKSEAIHDYDSALAHYNRALQADPTNIEYRLKATRLRFEDAQYHVEQGEKLQNSGDLQLALAEFQKAMMIDPSSPIAQQEVRKTMDELAAKRAAQNATPPQQKAEEQQQTRLMTGPPQLKPLSRAPINLKMTNDAKMVYDTVAKLAGLTVVFDPDFSSRQISIQLTNVTLEQALDIVSLEAKAFWKPVTNNIIFVAPDTPQMRREYQDEVVRTFYLKNTVQPQQLTEIVNGLRQLLDLRRVQQFNADNAIVIRDTPDKVMLAQRIIDDVDKPRPEVLIQFAVLQARTDRLRDLGIKPDTTAALAFTPPSSTTSSSSSSSSSSTTTNSLPLNQLQHLGSSDYSVTLPGATATALLTDSQTQIIDDPEIRIVDGEDAKLRIGDRVPIATGSFQAGVGVGTTGTTGSVINPLVNTQFQYLDVGVIVDVTPRIHPDHQISLKLSVEVSSVTGTQNIGGINQPVISTRRIEHDVRLQDGEVNILGGLIERTKSKTLAGWPGLSRIPFLRYFTSENTVENTDQEVLIVVIPHIIRMPDITPENLESIASGTDANPAVSLASQVMSPPIPPRAATPAVPSAPAPATAPGAQAGSPSASGQTAELGFQPSTVSLKAGQTTTVGVYVQNVQDLYSIPMLLQFNPAVVMVEDVRQGGFLSGGTQPVAIVQRVDKARGQAVISATRMPNTPGVSGSGTLFGVVLRGVAPGTSNLSILQVNARNSQQQAVPFVTTQATVRVQP